jgi:hypothetical protein
MLRRLAIIVALLTVMAAAMPAIGETLADVLQREVPSASPPPADVQSPITSYGVLNDSSHFLIGYYVVDTRDPQSKSLNPPLWILLLDKRSGSWQHREMQAKTDAFDAPENVCAGSVLNIKSVGKWFFLETHLTPSASCTFVLSRTLTVNHILYGWPVAFFSSGRAIVEGNAVHFVATHPLTVVVYDPATGIETPLLPRPDDTIWKDIGNNLSDVADESWCREHNAACDPKQFSGSLGEIAVNDHTNAAAFLVEYDGDGYGPKAEGFDVKVVYIFDLSGKTLRYREFKRDALEKLIGRFALDDLTQPAELRRLIPKDAMASR